MMDGIVESWNGGECRRGAGYGFIAYKKEDGSRGRVFYHVRHIIPDALGRIRDAQIVGVPVHFDLVPQADGRNVGKLMAIDVVPVFREPFVGNIEDHFEISRVHRWIIQGRNGWLKRADQEDLFFRVERVAEESRDLIPNLKLNDFLYHGVRQRPSLEYEADPILLYSPEEQAELQALGYHQGETPWEYMTLKE
jgi:cold shock CspA family protein